MTLYDDLIANETITGVRTKVMGYAASANLLITNWIVGGVGQQTFEGITQSIFVYVDVVSGLVRGYTSLDTSTDPGDEDAFDSGNASLTAAPGYLSNYGAGTFGTTRQGATFATGFWTFDNTAGVVPRTFFPGGLTFTWTGGSPPSPAPTYRNATDPTVYVNFDGSVTVAAGASLTLPIVANEIGSRSNAPASTITMTTVLAGVTGANAAAVLGVDRESRSVYIEKCREASSRLSFAGPADTYRYFAAKNTDGTPLLNALGAAVNITRVYVSQDSDQSIVSIYYASPSGAATSFDVAAANTNILINAFVVPDTISIGPGLPGGVAATEVPIHVVGSAKVKAKPGVTALGVKQAIVAALTSAFSSYDIGGVDQDTSGNGVIYTADIQAVAAVAYTALYDVLVTTPGGATTTLTTGCVATLNSTTADWTVTVVP